MEIPRIREETEFPKRDFLKSQSDCMVDLDQKKVFLSKFMLGQVFHIISVCFLDLIVKKTQAILLQNLLY